VTEVFGAQRTVLVEPSMQRFLPQSADLEPELVGDLAAPAPGFGDVDDVRVPEVLKTLGTGARPDAACRELPDDRRILLVEPAAKIRKIGPARVGSVVRRNFIRQERDVGGRVGLVRDAPAEPAISLHLRRVEPQAIADAMVDYFENLRQATLEAGVRENKSKFSWESLVEGLEKLYKMV